MSEVVFDYALFKAQFPEFDTVAYTEPLVNAQWDISTCYISTNVCTIKESCLALAINALTAHLFKLQVNSAITPTGGKATALVQSASVGGVSVSNVTPTNSNQFQFWLNQTPYGQMLLTLLQMKAVGGMYIGGSLERQNFRKSGGVF